MNTIDINSTPSKPIDKKYSASSIPNKKNIEEDAVINEKVHDLKELISVGEYDIDINKLGSVLLKNI